MKKSKKIAQKGFTLIEVVMATTALSVVLGGVMTLQSTTFKRTVNVNDKTFATEKTVQMFEELRSYVQANRESNITKLQNFSDGSSFNWILTTERRETQDETGVTSTDLLNPADDLSGNKMIGGSKWKYVRQIKVTPVPNDENARFVQVSVWLADPANNKFPRAYNQVKKEAPRPLATISGILKTNLSQDPPTQVYDLFLVALENSPSWWVDLADLRPSFERTLIDLEQRNPGLKYRRHFITRYGFGRDPYYMPYINDGNNADAQDMPWAFMYPGRINHAIGENYVLNNMRSRRRTDSGNEFFHVNTNHPHYATGAPESAYKHYSISDQFNHVMRWPEQQAMERRLGVIDPYYRNHPSLVNFLEDLNTPKGGDMKYRNAIIVNLHGELLPLPAIRNYSDPAKVPNKQALKHNGRANSGSPDYIPLANKRVVAHPENLRADNGSEISFRVHAYEEFGQGQVTLTDTTAALNPDAHNIPVISLFVPTSGKGPRYDGGVDGGFLLNPDFTPPAESAIRNALKIERIVGSQNKRYRIWSTDTSRHQGTGPFSRITYTHNPSQAATVFVGALSSSVSSGSSSIPMQDPVIPSGLPGDYSGFSSRNGTLHPNMTAYSSWSAAAKNTYNLAWTTGATGRSELEETLVVVDPGTANEEIVRVNSTSALSFNIVGTLKKSHPIGALVVRLEDYRVTSVNTTMLGHAQRGLKVELLDTPTRHPLKNNEGGLRNDRRLDELEYYPSPVNNNNFDDRDLTNTGNTNYKNTSRWRVSLNTGDASFGGGFDNQVMAVETRMVHEDYDNVTASLPVNQLGAALDCSQSGVNEICDGLWGDGDAYIPDNTSTAANENKRDMRPNLYNVSRTYVYMGHGFTQEPSSPNMTGNYVPQVEQFQYQGDAQYNPYADVKALNRFNRHFAQVSNNNGRNGFGATTNPSWDKTSIDLNWYFQLYSHGIMKSNSIYNSISGFSNYYFALGGELGTDGTNAVFNIRKQPWNSSNTGSTNENNQGTPNEITNTARVVMSTDGASTRWRMRPYLTELFPDDEYQFWVDNGNLPNLSYNATRDNRSTVAPQRRYYREKVNVAPRALPDQNKRIQTAGAPSFMNGNSNPSSNIDKGFQHDSTDGEGILNGGPGQAGRTLVDAFNLTLPDKIDSNRPFKLWGNAGSGAYTSSEMRALRNRLSYVNSPAGTTHANPDEFNAYYEHNSGSTRVSSAMIKMTRDSDNSLAGYVLMNGFKNQSGTGTQLMARFSQAGALQTFMDAGDLSVPASASGRTVQLPRVSITSPSAQRAYANPSVIPIAFDLAWKRWDEKKYSKAYPDDWYESTNLLFNIKYSDDNKKTWKYLDNSGVEGYYVDHYNPNAGLFSSTYELDTPSRSLSGFSELQWNVGSLPEGNYILRVEAYRDGFPDMGYAYHDVFVTIER